jgi:hypothetical protein
VGDGRIRGSPVGDGRIRGGPPSGDEPRRRLRWEVASRSPPPNSPALTSFSPLCARHAAPGRGGAAGGRGAARCRCARGLEELVPELTVICAQAGGGTRVRGWYNPHRVVPVSSSLSHQHQPSPPFSLHEPIPLHHYSTSAKEAGWRQHDAGARSRSRGRRGGGHDSFSSSSCSRSFPRYSGFIFPSRARTTATLDHWASFLHPS